MDVAAGGDDVLGVIGNFGRPEPFDRLFESDGAPESVQLLVCIRINAAGGVREVMGECFRQFHRILPWVVKPSVRGRPVASILGGRRIDCQRIEVRQVQAAEQLRVVGAAVFGFAEPCALR